jgi:hypothetical protein
MNVPAPQKYQLVQFGFSPNRAMEILCDLIADGGFVSKAVAQEKGVKSTGQVFYSILKNGINRPGASRFSGFVCDLISQYPTLSGAKISEADSRNYIERVRSGKVQFCTSSDIPLIITAVLKYHSWKIKAFNKIASAAPNLQTPLAPEQDKVIQTTTVTTAANGTLVSTTVTPEKTTTAVFPADDRVRYFVRIESGQRNDWIVSNKNGDTADVHFNDNVVLFPGEFVVMKARYIESENKFIDCVFLESKGKGKS